MSWRAGIAVLIVGAMILGVSPALAATPAGTGPGDAVDLGGTQSATLAPGKDFWYQIFDAGTSKPLGVVMNFTPATIENNPLVTFNVWLYEKRGFEVFFIQVGKGTVSGQPVGVKYWRGGTNVSRTYFLQVVNNTPDTTIDYAIAFTADAYNPPRLIIAPPPAAPMVPAAPAAPVAIAAPAPPAVGGTGIDDAIALTQPASGRILGQHVWYKVYYPGNSNESGSVAGVVLNFAPASTENNEEVAFKVWTYIATWFGSQLKEIGAGTRSGQPFGVKYWRHTGDKDSTFYIEVFNNSGEPVGYGVGQTGSAYPPGNVPLP